MAVAALNADRGREIPEPRFRLSGWVRAIADNKPAVRCDGPCLGQIPSSNIETEVIGQDRAQITHAALRVPNKRAIPCGLVRVSNNHRANRRGSECRAPCIARQESQVCQTGARAPQEWVLNTTVAATHDYGAVWRYTVSNAIERSAGKIAECRHSVSHA